MQQRQGGSEGDHHPRRSGEVAIPGALRRAQLLEAEDEQHRSQQVGERDREIHLVAVDLGAAARPLNISSIRSVTTNPPTTFVVARITATSPNAMVNGESAPAAMTIAPTRMMPWMAFVPDISGVCRMVGTLEMTAKPTKIASTKKVSSLRSSWVTPRKPSVSRAR